MENERDAVEALIEMQKKLFPQEDLIELRDLEMSFIYKPSSSIGGDYFKVIDSSSTIVIGDVSGHGFYSSLIVFMVNTLLVQLLDVIKMVDYKKIYDSINRFLSNYNEDYSLQIKTMTLNLIKYLGDGDFEVYGAHEIIFKIHSNGTIEEIETYDNGYLLGICSNMDINRIGVKKIHLEPGEMLFLYTDGLSENPNIAPSNLNETYYTDPKKFLAPLLLNKNAKTIDLVKIIANLTSSFTNDKYDNRFDDITFVVIKRNKKKDTL